MTVYVYFIREIRNKKKNRYGATKIGVARNIAKRLDALQTANPRELELVVAIPFDNRMQALSVEKKLHHQFRKFRIRGEWFHGELPLHKCMNMSIEVISDDDVEKPDDENVAYIEHFRSI